VSTKGKLFDITEGHNYSVLGGSCGSYLCEAKVGYDGPTGNGTPDGAFALTGAPVVTTEAATSITKTGATLNGTVNPDGVETKYYFQYGTSESYGKTTAEESAGSGTSNVKESKAITGLTAGTKYDFRIVATNTNKETTDGANKVFTTLPNAPENITLPVASPEAPDQAVPESSTTGTWTNSPTGYEYKWERCNATGGECATISGATSSKYTPVEADVGHTLVVTVTAKNSGGSTSVRAKATNPVKPIGEITEYSLPSGSEPFGITNGPDGNVWFTDCGTGKIGKITPSGTITEYAVASGECPGEIAKGPDGNLWFTAGGTGGEKEVVGKITTSGTVTEYSLPSKSSPEGITAGPDGNMWFTEVVPSKIVKITTSGTMTEYSLPAESYPEEITAGPDGNLWFPTWGTSKIGKITTSGTITEYSLPKENEPYGITTGPDNNLWCTAWGSGYIRKITTSGTITNYYTGYSTRGITAGPDGNLWFTTWGSTLIGRLTTSGVMTEYALPAGSVVVPRVTAGPDDNIWFTNNKLNKIGKITP